MRGLEIMLFLLSIIICLPLIPILVPGFNMGQGFDTGAADFNQANNFNWSKLQSMQPKEQSNPVIAIAEQTAYYFNFAVQAISWAGTLIFSALWAAPGLITAFGINTTLAAVLLSVFGIVLILAWLQITKGDDWSGRR
jgi:hypothetical protein